MIVIMLSEFCNMLSLGLTYQDLYIITHFGQNQIFGHGPFTIVYICTLIDELDIYVLGGGARIRWQLRTAAGER